jgi:tRNA-2-methylthio-N6-dimethylallyladenosine synthase
MDSQMNSMNFFIKVYGCQMNVHDSCRISSMLEGCGMRQIHDPNEAEMLIFYTCSVREKAVQKLYSDVGRMRSKKTKILAVGGCVAQQYAEKLFDKISNLNIVFGSRAYDKLPEMVESVLSGTNSRLVDTELGNLCLMHSPTFGKQSTSEFVKIQEGCDNFCTYCIVPHTRGREFSRPVSDIINEVKSLVSRGVQEIVLIGQNVNSYHGEAQYINIGDLSREWGIDRLLYEVANINGLKRLRYTTSHPKDFNENLMKAHRDLDPILVPFVHIPAQSGSNRILKLMNRGYTREEYLEKLQKFKSICTNMAFSSDFIVGFPEETESDFDETLDLVNKVGYASAYSFKYSPRSPTPASLMKNQIPEYKKDERLKKLQSLLSRSQLNFNQNTVGSVKNVLFEKHGKKENQYLGKTEYFQSVLVNSNFNLIGLFKNIKITQGNQNSLFGDIIEN